MQIPLKPFNNLEDLVPEDWRQPADGRAMFISAYELQGIAASEFVEYLACDLRDVRILFWKGELSHREEVKVLRLWMDATGILNVADPEPTRVVKTPDALYTVFLSPYNETEGTNAGELEAERRIEIAKALLASFQGRNVAYAKIFENTYSFATKRLSSWSLPIPLPFSFARPALSQSALAPTLAAEKARCSLPDDQRNRVDLSLRWMGQAIYAHGVDGFLKYWLAIEILSMRGETDIASLNEILAGAYDLGSAREARSRFHTGLLFGLRSQIVHHGFLAAIDGRLLRYCEFLYHDVLRARLGLAREGRLEMLRSSGSFDFGAYLHTLLKSAG